MTEEDPQTPALFVADNESLNAPGAPVGPLRKKLIPLPRVRSLVFPPEPNLNGTKEQEEAEEEEWVATPRDSTMTLLRVTIVNNITDVATRCMAESTYKLYIPTYHLECIMLQHPAATTLEVQLRKQMRPMLSNTQNLSEIHLWALCNFSIFPASQEEELSMLAMRILCFLQSSDTARAVISRSFNYHLLSETTGESAPTMTTEQQPVLHLKITCL